jgi:superfamily II DNA/RNA helicase
MLFSATFPKEIQVLAMDFLFNYIWVAVGVVGGVAENVDQKFVQVSGSDKVNALLNLIRPVNSGGALMTNNKRVNNNGVELLKLLGGGSTGNGNAPQAVESTLVFVARKKTASFVASVLSRQGISAAEIHGDISQTERERALAMFRTKQVSVLVASDVAARGLDIPAVAHVVNFDLPGSIDDYVHRIGRTGRIGNTGRATSFCCRDEPNGIAKELVAMLQNCASTTEIPQFLLQEAFAGGHRNRGPASAGFRFGARDARNGNFDKRKAAATAPTF